MIQTKRPIRLIPVRLRVVVVVFSVAIGRCCTGAVGFAQDPGSVVGSVDQQFWLAVRDGNLDRVNDLLRRGASANARDANGWSALDYATLNGLDNIAHALLDAGATLDIQSAAALGDDYHLKLMLESDPGLVGVQPDGWFALAFAAARGRLTSAKILIDFGADPNARSGSLRITPLHWAARGGGAQVVRLLVKAGSRMNATDTNRRSALMYAAEYGQREAAEALIQSGADLWLRDKGGSTALDYAATFGQAGVVKLLLRNSPPKAAINSAFLSAANGGYSEILKALASSGAALETSNNVAKQTALQLAVENGHVEATETLLDMGASARAIDRDGRTALHYAAEHGNVLLVQLLLKHGALPGSADNAGITPLDLATALGHKEVAGVLARWGANREK